MDELRFRYETAPIRMSLAIVGGLALAAFAVWDALNDDRGLLINRVIALDPWQAKLFLLACGGLLALFALLSLYALLAQRSRASAVVLRADALEAPKSALSATIRRVPYRAIRNLEVRAVNRQRFLHVFVEGERKLIIPASHVERGAGFDALVQALDARVAAVQPRRA